jgi:hypothetical protein
METINKDLLKEGHRIAASYGNMYFNNDIFKDIGGKKHLFGRLIYIPNTEFYHFKVRYTTEVARAVWKVVAKKKPELMEFMLYTKSYDGMYVTMGGCFPRYCGLKGTLLDAYDQVRKELA